MRGVATTLAVMAALLVGCGREQVPQKSEAPKPSASPVSVGQPVGALRLTCDPPRGLVFLDGRFAGDLAASPDLLVGLPCGNIQLRISEAGYMDLVQTVEVVAGVERALHARLGKTKPAWQVPATPILLQVGQPARGWLSAGTISYLIDESHSPRRLIATLAGRPQFRVQREDGTEIPLQRLPGYIDGCPGGALFTYESEAKGRYLLTVSGPEGPFAFKLLQDPPPPAQTEKPHLKRRRGPPVAPK